jgi:hypothetical protein
MLALCALAGAAQAAERAQTYFFLVFNAPVAGREPEYNRWYQEQHAPDVVSIPGFVSAQRFVYNDVQLRAVALKKPRYLVIYKIVTADLPAVIAEVKHRLQTGQTRISASLDPQSGQMYMYRALGPEVRAHHAVPAHAPLYYQVVFGDATAGKDTEFNRWYDRVHVPDMLSGPGFVSAQRGIISDVQMEPITQPSRYLALFEIATADLPAAFGAQGHDGEPPPAFDRARTFGYTYRAMGPPLLGDQVRAARAQHAP